MPRPTTKPDLIHTANEAFAKMWKLIDSMTDEERTAAFHFTGDQKEAHWRRDQNLRDVLTHLYEWHQLLIGWIQANQSGEKRPFLPEPYTWATYAGMNMGFWEKHQKTPYLDAERMLKASHQKVMDLIAAFSGEELFERKHFSWTGSTTLGSYCISATSSHYDWAIKKLKAHRKSYQDK